MYTFVVINGFIDTYDVTWCFLRYGSWGEEKGCSVVVSGGVVMTS